MATIVNLTHYELRYEGLMYEIFNKVTGRVEAYHEVLPTAIGQMIAFDSALEKFISMLEVPSEITS